VAAHKATKTQLNQLTAKYDQLQATRSEANGQLTALEFEVSKLVSKCEVGQVVAVCHVMVSSQKKNSTKYLLPKK